MSLALLVEGEQVLGYEKVVEEKEVVVHGQGCHVAIPPYTLIFYSFKVRQTLLDLLANKIRLLAPFWDI